MNNTRIGIGFDIHKFSKGRKLFLGGVQIPFVLGLKGHSDADVLLHALCDALLGALGKSDIGFYFPNNDLKYKNKSSHTFVKKVMGMVGKAKFKIVNIDCVLILDRPKVLDFTDKIKQSIASMLSISQNAIGLKAKTTEGILSYSKKGIAAYCVVLLRQAGGR